MSQASAPERSVNGKSVGAFAHASHPTLPDVAPLRGLLPANAVTGWNGIVVPAATPRPIVARLHAGFLAALDSSEVRRVLADLHMERVTASPEQFDAFIRAEIVRWGDVVKRAGIRLH